jgi:hypothetical protein
MHGKFYSLRIQHQDEWNAPRSQTRADKTDQSPPISAMTLPRSAFSDYTYITFYIS